MKTLLEHLLRLALFFGIIYGGYFILSKMIYKPNHYTQVSSEVIKPPVAPNKPATPIKAGNPTKAKASEVTKPVASSKPVVEVKDKSQLAAVMAGIAGVESGGAKNPYKLLSISSGNGDRAHGKYQIMGNNIPSWTKAALGKSLTKQEFLNSPDAQEKTAAFIIGGYLKHYSPQDTASMWFSGRPQSKAGNAKDAYGTSVPMYIKAFNKYYNKYLGK